MIGSTEIGQFFFNCQVSKNPLFLRVFNVFDKMLKVKLVNQGKIDCLVSARHTKTILKATSGSFFESVKK